MKNIFLKTDCGIIGGGLAGCAIALEIADSGKKVALFVKKNCKKILIVILQQAD